jgi:hypothetical protein
MQSSPGPEYPDSRRIGLGPPFRQPTPKTCAK